MKHSRGGPTDSDASGAENPVAVGLKVQVWIYGYGHQSEKLQVLLLRVVPGRGGGWHPVTGSVEAGEELAQAALREALEETGLLFHGLPRPLGVEFEFKGQWGPARETAFCLEAAVPAGSSIQLDPSEHFDFAWCTADDAESRLSYAGQRAGLHALRRLIGS